ncbi:MAG: Spo0E family sporulation regulatory protein-aspartic acid phosphatase [Epulopiscium sp.]|nr:Spo0E family sporulation regulatory protein-aspartic acid phosphatase [Candidatus Epulonipiscium sp.]
MSVFSDKINDLNDKLDDIIIKQSERHNIYKLSQELDELIILFYQKNKHTK